MDIDEYITEVGKVITKDDKNNDVKELQNKLNEYAQKGYELVSLHQYIFNGLQYSFVMKRRLQ